MASSNDLVARISTEDPASDGEAVYYLPSYPGLDWQVALSEYAELEQQESIIQLRKGALAAGIETRYGQKSIETFAQEIGAVAGTLYDYRNVYTRLASLPISDRSEILAGMTEGDLYYSYLLVCLPVHNDEAFCSLLREARENGWSKRRVALESAQVRGVTSRQENREEVEAGVPLLDGLDEEERDRLAERQLELEQRESAGLSRGVGPEEGAYEPAPEDIEEPEGAVAHTCPQCHGWGRIWTREGGDDGRSIDHLR